MLMSSDRHTPSDLELWQVQEDADHVYSRAKELAKKAVAAIHEIRKFLRSPAYCGVSWGKDSVVVADLVLRACRIYGIEQPAIVWIRVEPICNPDCLSVRDEFLAAYDCRYHEIIEHCEWGDGEWHASGTLEAGFSRAVELTGARRYISGVRADESGARKIMARTHGASTRSTCRPITWWSVQDVFSWLAAKDLPAHPVYAMQGGGRWPRERIRVASLGGRRGSGIGRSEWEREYYGDVLRRLESGKGPTVGRK